MSKSLIAVATLAAIASVPAARAAEVHLTATNPVVELEVAEDVESAPDLAIIGTGVTTRAPTAKEALAANNVEMKSVVDRIRKLGVAAKDIQTSGLSLNPQYEYQDGKQPRFLGYEVANQVQVKVRNIARLGELLDGFVAAGATNISGPTFTLDDDVAAKAAARQRAFTRSKMQAEDYAKAAGYTGVRLLSVAERISGSGPVVYSARAKAFAADAAVPIAPGQVSTSITLDLKYEMIR